jgi:hypothetical protein
VTALGLARVPFLSDPPRSRQAYWSLDGNGPEGTRAIQPSDDLSSSPGTEADTRSLGWPGQAREQYPELAPKNWVVTRGKLAETELAAPVGAITVPA